MARIFKERTRIDRSSVVRFFDERAAKVDQVGALSAVLYQDKNPELARRRDETERALLLPKLRLDRDARVLDLGCGTGRWAEAILPHCGRYLGIDVSPGLVEVARARCAKHPHGAFRVGSVDALVLPDADAADFSHILCCGVLVYLNDDELLKTFGHITKLAATAARFVLREPVGISERLTIKEHFSEDMDQHYNAIYRTERELLEMAAPTLFVAGFTLVDSGDVYTDSTLNNRTETRQRWFLFSR